MAETKLAIEAVRRGWRIGTHAVGDRAVRTLLDVYQAGTDIVRPFNPMTNVWGMVTRGPTPPGSRVRSMPSTSSRRSGWAASAPGELADLVGYPADPLAADPDNLAGLTPAFTIVGGRATQDPDKRLAP